MTTDVELVGLVRQTELDHGLAGWTTGGVWHCRCRQSSGGDHARHRAEMTLAAIDQAGRLAPDPAAGRADPRWHLDEAGRHE